MTRINFTTILFALSLAAQVTACGDKSSAEVAKPSPPVEATPTTTSPDVEQTPEGAFKAAIIDFVENGGAERYGAVLSSRMIERQQQRQAEADADADKRAEIAGFATRLGLPETATVMEIGAAVWQQGLAPALEEMRAADVEISQSRDRTVATFKGVNLEGDPLQITVVDEDGVLKIDEN